MGPLLVTLVDAITGKALDTNTSGGKIILTTQTGAIANGQFKSISFSTATTNALVTPPLGTAIVISDIILSVEKVAGGDVAIQFTDGIQTIIITHPIVVDAPANLAINFGGRWRGWRDARIDVVSTGSNISGNVSIGYQFVTGEEALDFAEWDALR